MALLIASDLHIAKVWDRVEQALPEETNVLNPNRNFREVVRRVRKEDTLLINGDLVDYQDAGYDADDGTNWDLFFGILKRCEGDYLLNLGNHDYRRSPYNFSIYGLRHNNVEDGMRKRYAEAIGFDSFRWFGELGSVLRCPPEKGLPYPFAPCQHREKEGCDLVLLDVGADAFNHARNLFDPRRWHFLFCDPPAADGLSDEQLASLEAHLTPSKKELLIFLHVPPFFSAERLTGRFERTYTIDHGRLSSGTFFQNNERFIQLLIRSGRRVTVVGSHTHIPGYFLLEKKRRLIRSSTLAEINRQQGDPAFIRFIVTPALGAIRPPQRRVGYVRYEAGRFTQVTLREYPPAKR